MCIHVCVSMLGVRVIFALHNQSERANAGCAANAAFISRNRTTILLLISVVVYVCMLGLSTPAFS